MEICEMKLQEAIDINNNIIRGINQGHHDLTDIDKKALTTLSSLAEKVLAVGKDLPQKDEFYSKDPNHKCSYSQCSCEEEAKHNQAINDCQLVIAKNYWKKVSKEELASILYDVILDGKKPKQEMAARLETLVYADAIIERLEGL